jgi:hypothetical protein
VIGPVVEGRSGLEGAMCGWSVVREATDVRMSVREGGGVVVASASDAMGTLHAAAGAAGRCRG